MRGMFCDASSFNQPLGDWRLRPYCNTSYMFRGINFRNSSASAFNQLLGDWRLRPDCDTSDDDEDADENERRSEGDAGSICSIS